MQSIEEQRKRLRIAMKRGDRITARGIAEALSSHNLPDVNLACGIIYENCAFEEDDARFFDDAWGYYFKLMTDFDESEGYVGCARIILAREDAAKADTAVRYCHYAIERDRNPFAYLVLGRVYEQFFLPEKVKPALRAYWQSAWRGAAFGMRRYANLHWRHGSRTVAIVAHIVATFLFPLFRLFGGSRALRPG